MATPAGDAAAAATLDDIRVLERRASTSPEVGFGGTLGLLLFAARVVNWPAACAATVLFSATRKWATLGADVLTEAAVQSGTPYDELAAMEQFSFDRAMSALGVLRPDRLFAGHAVAAALGLVLVGGCNSAKPPVQTAPQTVYPEHTHLVATGTSTVYRSSSGTRTTRFSSSTTGVRARVFMRGRA